MNNWPNPISPITCPECENPIRLVQVIKKGLILECPACGIESEVISEIPLKLAPLEEEK